MTDANLSPFIDFGRDICGDLAAAEKREWLVTNGRGSYASGTVAGLLTRRYHGLLVASLQPPVQRTLLLTKLDDAVRYQGDDYALFVNRWRDGTVNPAGFQNLERFHLEGTVPVWTYAIGDALLEKRVWLEPGADTTYIQYRLRRASDTLDLQAKALVNWRDHHQSTKASDWGLTIEPVSRGLCLERDGVHLHLLSSGAGILADHQWYKGFQLAVEAFRGLPETDDNLYAGTWHARLAPGDSLTLVASIDPQPDLDGAAAYTRRQAYEAEVVAQAAATLPVDEPAIRQLVLAADQFIVRRATPADPAGRTIVAGYHWFTDWGRDTMIALPGLTLATGRPAIAAAILRTFARHVDRGMIPNRFPDEGEAPEYNTVDATLWYFEAIRAYVAASGDQALLAELLPLLEEIVAWHRRGTRYQIKMDPADGLLYAGEAGVQLTWMDAKVDDWVVTPRIGKPVEINALWYNALCFLAAAGASLGRDGAEYAALAARVKDSFGRFWSEPAGYLFDVIDGPDGDDPALRPNQLLAVALEYSPLTAAQQASIVSACGGALLTSHGLRSLSPWDDDFIGSYQGDQEERDGAYHQGTVWGWLIGPFVAAHYRVHKDPALARTFLAPLLRHLSDHGLGTISEIFTGDPPFAPRGCIAQAWSVAEVLRVWQLTGE